MFVPVIKVMKIKRGTARAKRRAGGDYKPVNEMASRTQHPQGRFARNAPPVVVDVAMAFGHDVEESLP